MLEILTSDDINMIKEKAMYEKRKLFEKYGWEVEYTLTNGDVNLILEAYQICIEEKKVNND